MNKIYNENDCWVVDELTDIYYFKSVNQNTGLESSEVLSWTRMIDLSSYSGNPVRMYDIEFNSKKYYFLLYEFGDRYKLEVENKYEFDELCKEKNIILLPEIKQITI